MIKINVNKKKKIEFDVDVKGVQCEALSGRLSLFYEGMIYSFPATIEDANVIKVEIPALNEIISDIPDKYQADLKLEVVGNDTFMMPWTGSAYLEHPVQVEATMRGSKKLVEEEEIPKIKIGSIREEEEDEKSCPEGQRWCPIQKKCVEPAKNEEEDDLDEKKKDSAKTWAGASMKAAKEPVKPRKKKSKLGEALLTEKEKEEKEKRKNLGKALGEALLKK